MKKKMVCVLLAVVMLVAVFAGCGTGTPAEGDAAANTEGQAEPVANGGDQQDNSEASGKTFKIALLPTDMSATFAAWLAQELQIAIEKYPNMELTILDSKNVLSTQMSNLENCVAQGYDYIILHPLEPDAQAETVDQYIQDGTPILMINQSDGGSEFASNVDCDPVEQGKIVAEIAKEKIPQGGKVVTLLGPSGNSHSMGRREGFQEVLFDQRPDIEILDEQIGDWEKSKGMNFMEDWLQAYGQIDAVISMNDAMALGAWEAAKDANRTDGLTLYGIDGLADAVLSIEEGGLTATCVQNAKVMAETALEIIDRVLSGEIEFEKTLIDGALIDSNNVEEWLQVHRENGQIK